MDGSAVMASTVLYRPDLHDVAVLPCRVKFLFFFSYFIFVNIQLTIPGLSLIIGQDARTESDTAVICLSVLISGMM